MQGFSTQSRKFAFSFYEEMKDCLIFINNTLTLSQTYSRSCEVARINQGDADAALKIITIVAKVSCQLTATTLTTVFD